MAWESKEVGGVKADDRDETLELAVLHPDAAWEIFLCLLIFFATLSFLGRLSIDSCMYAPLSITPGIPLMEP